MSIKLIHLINILNNDNKKTEVGINNSSIVIF